MLDSAGTALLALVTTIHLASFLVLRNRLGLTGASLPALAPSFLLTGLPWLLPQHLWLAAGLLLQFLWHSVSKRERRAGQPVAEPPEPARRPAVAPPRRSEAPRSNDFQELPVLAVLDETPDIKTFRLRRPPGLSFCPGQFLMVRVAVDGQPKVRCYSISSAPEATGYLEISVRRHGLVSRCLHATVKPGALLAVKGPAGGFTYPSDDSRPVVLVAAGVGITPLMSMLRHAVAADPLRPVTLLYSARHEADVAFRDELVTMSRRNAHVRVHVTLTGPNPPAGWPAGRIDERLVLSLVSDPTQAIFLLCGPSPMLDATKALLASLGVPAGQVRAEAFEAAVAVASGAAAAPEKPAPRAASPATRAILTLERSGRRSEATVGQTLLEAAEAAGGDIPSLCRGGACGTCKTRLVAGDVDFADDLLAPADRQNGYVLPCVAYMRGDCTLEA